jgi:hypothetical protein
VDAAIADVLGTLPPGRLLALVMGRVVEADQALADRKAEEAASARTVWTSRDDDRGTRTLMVRGTSHGVRRLHGTINHLARLLLQHGGVDQRTQSMDQLRADAAELLANPLAALKLMIGSGEAACPDQVAEAIREAGPSKVRPAAVVYLRMTPESLPGGGVARAEEVGALTRQQLVDVLGHHQISLRPVVDLNEGMAADSYEVPAAIDERLQLSKPADVFPFASSMSRNLDRDHTEAYDEDGPPGQTREANLGKLSRHHHRIKTHGGWLVEQRNVRFTWITPHGRVFITDGNGTHAPRAKTSGRPDIYWSAAA